MTSCTQMSLQKYLQHQVPQQAAPHTGHKEKTPRHVNFRDAQMLVFMIHAVDDWMIHGHLTLIPKHITKLTTASTKCI